MHDPYLSNGHIQSTVVRQWMKHMSTAFGDQAVTPIAYTIRGAVAASGFSRSRIYELIARGQIEARKDGRKTLIVAASLAAYIATLPPIAPSKIDRSDLMN